MLSKKPMGAKELDNWENSRDVAAELEQSINEMISGQGKVVVVSPIAAVRLKIGLSQGLFAKMLGVSVRTLQEWEQGRRKPSGAAQTLLTIAQKHPEILSELISA